MTNTLPDDWSDARKRAWNLRHVNPNAYYYRHLPPGQKQHTGGWTPAEKDRFFRRLAECPIAGSSSPQWGMFSTKIPGRVGYQCANYYRLLIKKGEIHDPNYSMDPETGELVYNGTHKGGGRKPKGYRKGVGAGQKRARIEVPSLLGPCPMGPTIRTTRDGQYQLRQFQAVNGSIYSTGDFVHVSTEEDGKFHVAQIEQIFTTQDPELVGQKVRTVLSEKKGAAAQKKNEELREAAAHLVRVRLRWFYRVDETPFFVKENAVYRFAKNEIFDSLYNDENPAEVIEHLSSIEYVSTLPKSAEFMELQTEAALRKQSRRRSKKSAEDAGDSVEAAVKSALSSTYIVRFLYSPKSKTLFRRVDGRTGKPVAKATLEKRVKKREMQDAQQTALAMMKAEMPPDTSSSESDDEEEEEEEIHDEAMENEAVPEHGKSVLGCEVPTNIPQYEVERLERLQRNQEMLASLGLLRHSEGGGVVLNFPKVKASNNIGVAAKKPAMATPDVPQPIRRGRKTRRA